MVLPTEVSKTVAREGVPAIEAWLRGGGHVDAGGGEAGGTMLMLASALVVLDFFFNDTATTEIYT